MVRLELTLLALALSACTLVNDPSDLRFVRRDTGPVIEIDGGVLDGGRDSAPPLGMDAGGCEAATDCDDGDPCTLDRCEAGTCSFTDTCTPAPDCAGDDDCVDAFDCTVDRCDRGVCVNTADDTACDDGNPCTRGFCAPSAGCQLVDDDDARCSDGDPCTTADRCSAGVCRGIGACDAGLRDADTPDAATCAVGETPCGSGSRATCCPPMDVCVGGICAPADAGLDASAPVCGEGGSCATTCCRGECCAVGFVCEALGCTSP